MTPHAHPDLTWLTCTMRTRLGKSGLKISKIVLGTMGFGSKQWQDWVLDEEESLKVIEYAYKQGINTWDTVSDRAETGQGFQFHHKDSSWGLD